MKIFNDKIQIGIVALALTLRLAFLLYGAEAYYGNDLKHETGDTHSYTDSFINLFENGHYTFNPKIPEASYGRLPGYPFFYGLHYIIFGEKYSYFAISVTQMLLEIATLLMLGSIAYSITGNIKTKYITSFIYAAYPFSIVWITIVGTETLSIFLLTLWLYLLIKPNTHYKDYFFLGIVIACCFFVREFLGIILPVSCLFIYIKFQKSVSFSLLLKRLIYLVSAFMCLYIWWPLRNYINHDTIVLIKPPSAGYANLTEDVSSYIKWYHCWSNDDNEWISKATSNEPFVYPDNLFKTNTDRIFADSTIALSRTCGSGFYHRKYNTDAMFVNCNKEISKRFSKLKDLYKKDHPFEYYTKVPLQNLKKAFFKASIETKKSIPVTILIFTLFIARTALLIIGLGYLFISIKKEINLLPILFYFTFIYAFICFYFRSLEMRYIIHADILLLVPAGIALTNFLFKKVLK